MGRKGGARGGGGGYAVETLVTLPVSGVCCGFLLFLLLFCILLRLFLVLRFFLLPHVVGLVLRVTSLCQVMCYMSVACNGRVYVLHVCGM